MPDTATAAAPSTAVVDGGGRGFVTYTAVLPMSARVVARVADLLAEHRAVIGTRAGRRALSCWEQAVAFGRWILQAVKVADLRVDLGLATSTMYTYVHEALDVLAAQAPSLHGALLAARVAGYAHVSIDGTLIPTDRVAVPGPTSRKTRGKNRRKITAEDVAAGAENTETTEKVDLFWSGKHHCHGGNVQVVTAPDGWPLWVSPVRPGREHDITCARTHGGLLAALAQWVDAEHTVLGDLGYQGERHLITTPVKAPAGAALDEPTKSANRAHNGVRARAEAENAWLKTRYTALRRVTLCPWRIGAITAAAIVLLHLEHNRTT